VPDRTNAKRISTMIVFGIVSVRVPAAPIVDSVCEHHALYTVPVALDHARSTESNAVSRPLCVSNARKCDSDQRTVLPSCLKLEFAA
jgi:hypothetical protein